MIDNRVVQVTWANSLSRRMKSVWPLRPSGRPQSYLFDSYNPIGGKMLSIFIKSKHAGVTPGLVGSRFFRLSAAFPVIFMLVVLSTTTETTEISFTRHIVADQFDGACSVHAADIDADGDVDILGCAFYGDDLSLWLNPGDSPDGWPVTVIESNFNGAHFVNTGDIDNDGDLDIVAVAQLAGEVAWWRNDGGDPIVWVRFPVDESYAGAQQVFPVDMDGDEDLDLVCTAYSINDVSWYRNDGAFGWSKQLISDTANGSVSVCVADLDNDADYDVLTANYNTGRISWWRNDGNPVNWSEVIIDNNFAGAHEVRVGDIDGDGDLDILGVAFALNDVKWWRNDGGEPISWTELMINGSFAGASSVSCADLDADGDMDVLAAAHIAGDFAWWSNEGGDPVTWSKYTIEYSFAEAWPIIAYDIDQDEDLDVLAGGRAVNRVAWYENQGTVGAEPFSVPEMSVINQNHPNPFSTNTSITYNLMSPARVKLTVFDLAGRPVSTLVEERQGSGEYEVRFESNGFPSGTYFYTLSAGGQHHVRRMLLIK